MLRMPSHILLSLWNTSRNLQEEQNKAEKKAYDDKSGAQSMNMNPSSMMAQAKGMLPPIPSIGGISGIPNVGSFKAK